MKAKIFVILIVLIIPFITYSQVLKREINEIETMLPHEKIIGSIINNYVFVPSIPDSLIVNKFIDDNGKEVNVMVIPGIPPSSIFLAPVASFTAGAVALSNVPAFDWSFGCSATSAAMMAGYYDNNGYPNMYTGPTNGGIMPLTNQIWGSVVINGETRKQCPLSATRNGVDGRTTRGHVDDYWIKYGNNDPDPFITNGWTQHTYGDCTGDYMKTNQSNYGNSDGSTTFYYYINGSPFSGNYDADLAYGFGLFFNSRGYTVVNRYNQLIYGFNGNTLGFTFTQYVNEINAGRPVMIQVAGHSMVGFGYDLTGNIVYIRDTWDYSTHTMTWGGSYAGMDHVAVSVFQLAPASLSAPVAQAATNITQTGFSANWSASSGATGYYLDVSTSSTFSSFVTGYNNKSVGNVVTSAIIGLSAGTSYYYRVRASNTSGTTGNSNTITVITRPSNPVAIAATNITQTGFSANWIASATATGYYLDVSTSSLFTSFVTGYNNKSVGNVITSTVGGLAANTTYYYRVRAFNANGTSGNSNTISPKTLAVPIPVAIAASNITQTGFSANWNASATATGYYLDVSTSSLFTSFVTGYNNKSVGNVITSTVGGLAANTTYYYRVRAFNANGTSGNSNTISPKTLAVPIPVAIAASNITQTGFSANWNASATATGYYLDVSTSSLFTSFVTGYNNKSVGNVITSTVGGLAANTTYYYRVRAFNANGTSGNSNTVSTVTKFLTVSTETVSLAYNSGSNGTFSITSNTTWNITDDGGWLDVLPLAGSNNGTITVTANSANTGASARAATVTIAGTGVTSKTVTVTQAAPSPTTVNLGNTTIYSSSATLGNRVAMPVTFTEAGSIQSITIYHNGGTGNVLLGVYSNAGTAPATQLGVSASTPINASTGWQTVPLNSAVSVASGTTVWLSFVFQTNPGIRYLAGTPARALSTATWSGGMPATFGTATFANFKFSLYCTYIPGVVPKFLTVSPASISLGSASGTNGTFSIASNTTWSITDDAGWLDVSPLSGSNDGTITVTANSANTGASARTATVTIAGTGVTSKTVTVTQAAPSTTTVNLGNTTIYTSSATLGNRVAMPVTFTEAGSIQSITIYHNGGTGNVLLGVYSDAATAPATQLGVSASTPINASTGWQTVHLISPVSVASGQTVWLSFVFQTNPGIRYLVGTPARALSTATWSGGMPATFGTATFANFKYSLYCTYIPAPITQDLGNTTIYSSSATLGNLVAMPVTFTEAGSIQSITIYHNGGTGNVLLGVYSDAATAPATQLGVSASTVINSGPGWQTVPLNSAVSVISGQTVWLSFVFQTNPGIRYIAGTPARALSTATWSGGMPATFGTATFANFKYSLYCTYTTGAAGSSLAATTDLPKSAEIATAITPEIELAHLKVYPNPFSNRLRFEFVSPESVDARIELYDMTGRLVKNIFEQPIEGGVNYEAEFRPETIISGMYIYRMTLGDAIYNGKVVFKKE